MLTTIDKIFQNSFDQFIEEMFRESSERPKNTAFELPYNLGEFIELYRSTHRLEVKKREMMKVIEGKNQLIQKLKQELSTLRVREKQYRRHIQRTKKSSLEKSRFLAEISHEMRTPLNSVIGISNLLTQTELTSEQQHYIDMLKVSSNSLLSLIDDVLDYARMASGKMTLRQKNFGLSGLLEETSEMMSIKAREKNLGLHHHFDPRIPNELIGDPDRLRQVLLNLISNAVKYTPRGEVKIEIELKEQSTTSCRVLFLVKDTGSGISQEHQSGLFDHFTRANQAESESSEGAGLGLAICKQLVALMGGGIGVESTPGQGSTFWFTAGFGLPGTQPGSDEADSPPAVISADEPDDLTAEIKPVQVLVVEDDPINRRVYRTLLEKLDCRVETAESGEEALVFLRDQDFDLVFMDVQLPGMSGLETTRRIREGEGEVRNPEIPIIALTARAMNDDRECCLKAGMTDYLVKPLAMETLKQIVARYRHPASLAPVQTEHPANPCDRLPTIDTDRLSELAEDIEDRFVPLLQMFINHLPQKLDQIKQAIESGDYPLLRETAHQLKGNSANFHAPKLAGLCRQFECIDPSLPNPSVTPLIEQLTAEIAAVTKAMDAFIH